MECQPAFGVHRIDFTLDAKAKDIRDQVAFIILVSRRFKCEISDVGAFKSHEGIKFFVSLQFEGYDPWDDARVHCNSHLDSKGRVNASYRGALEYADRGFVGTDALLQRLRTVPPN